MLIDLRALVKLNEAWQWDNSNQRIVWHELPGQMCIEAMPRSLAWIVASDYPEVVPEVSRQLGV